MSKQSAIILILTVFLGALGALIWFYFNISNNNQIEPVPFPLNPTETYNPFDNTVKTTTIPSSTTTSTSTANITEVVPVTLSKDKLRQISDTPQSGFSITEDTKTKRTIIRYSLRLNSNIYEAYTDSAESKRLSITTVPKSYESLWLPDGQNLILRYLKDKTEDIQTFSVKINPATTTLNEFQGGIDGSFLPENIKSLVINPLGDKIFYLLNNSKGSSGYVSKPSGLNKKLIFESPTTEWNISWPKEGIITFNSKPSSSVEGYLYFLNSTNGDFSKVLGKINGLTTKTDKTAASVLYSDSIRNTPRLYLFNIKTNESKLLPWSTFPEKCLWSNTDSKIIYCAVPKNFPTGDYPDVWYQGLVNFTDDVWLINTDTMSSTLVFDPQRQANKNLDMTDLQLDKNDNFLFFTNKTDLTLWSLNLK